ncbi:hypothetical protein OAL65_03100 [Candidatus Pelagibacter sp.]|nr:hypothetical protein [Candidatus Pelagibacter sp.]
MSKKVINQKTNFDSEFLNSTGSDFIFDENPINRLKNTSNVLKKDLNIQKIDKVKELEDLKEQINSISDCNLKNNSKKMVLGDGNINSPIMIIGEAPGVEEDNSGLAFMGEVGDLLKKMLIAINIEKQNIYTTYAVNFRPPEDRKPNSTEIKRYSQFLQKHISIINPKIIILMGSTAMESLTGLNSKISIERGKWKEVIVKNTSYNVIITFNPSYLLRAPEIIKNLRNIKCFPIFVSSNVYEPKNKNTFIIGDAFFALPPTFAQGASQSIEAAHELYKNLENENTQFNFERVKRVKMIDIKSKLNYFAFHLSNPLTIWIRNLIIQKLVKNKKFINSYLGKIYKD